MNSLDSAWYQRQSERLAELAGLRAKVEECYVAWNRASEELAEKTAEYRKGIDEGGAALAPRPVRTIKPVGKAKAGSRNGPLLKKALRAICGAPCDIATLARVVGTAEAYLRNKVLPKICEQELARNYLGTWEITDKGREQLGLFKLREGVRNGGGEASK